MGEVLLQVLGDRPLALLVVVDEVGVGLLDRGPDTVEGSLSSLGTPRMYRSSKGLAPVLSGGGGTGLGRTARMAPHLPGVSEEPWHLWCGVCQCDSRERTGSSAN